MTHIATGKAHSHRNSGSAYLDRSSSECPLVDHFCNAEVTIDVARRHDCAMWVSRAKPSSAQAPTPGPPQQQDSRRSASEPSFASWLSSDTLDGVTALHGRPVDVYGADTTPYESLTLVGMGINFGGQ